MKCGDADNKFMILVFTFQTHLSLGVRWSAYYSINKIGYLRLLALHSFLRAKGGLFDIYRSNLRFSLFTNFSFGRV